MANVILKDLYKKYAGKNAVNNLSATIPSGELTVITGPTGAGKSALIRTICGLDNADGGTISIDGVVVNRLEPKDRDVAIVLKGASFHQNQTVYENMAFGLKMRKVPKDVIDKKVRAVAEVLGLTPYLQRFPKNISAGQRQRVMLGRAIARDPKLVIFDDPISDLPEDLRHELRTEIVKLNKRLKTNFIYVTKSPQEALVMADRIMFMEDGKLIQYGTPLELYDRPTTLSVATYFGAPAINIFVGKLTKEGEDIYGLFQGARVRIPFSLSDGAVKEYVDTGRNVTFAFRPEDLSVSEGGELKVRIDGVMEEGEGVKVATVSALGCDSPIAFSALIDGEEGAEVTLGINKEHLLLYDTKSEEIIN